MSHLNHLCTAHDLYHGIHEDAGRCCSKKCIWRDNKAGDGNTFGQAKLRIFFKPHPYCKTARCANTTNSYLRFMYRICSVPYRVRLREYGVCYEYLKENDLIRRYAERCVASLNDKLTAPISPLNGMCLYLAD